MNKLFSIIIFSICFVLFGIYSLFQYKMLKESGTYDLPILSQNVDVHFDSFGIPHIEGKNIEDTYRVLGYIMANERLFQMDLLRRLITGRLSEVFGEETVEADILLRKLRLKKTAEEFLKSKQEQIDPKMLNQIDAFLEGVHYFMDHKSLPLEFSLLGYEPPHFEVADIVGIAGYMALTFAEGITGDVLNSELMEKLPEEKMKMIRIGSDTDKDYFPNEKIVRSKFLNNLNITLEKISEYIPLFHGSNSWILSGERTISGKPILANDPHIAVSNPHIFYEAHIKAPELELYGEFIPLSPFAVMGHTPYSAWGITMAEIDDLTVYLEKINPQDKNLVMFKNEWVELKREVETIIIKGQNSKDIEVFRTPHGPLMDGTKFGVEGKNLSLHWSVYHPDNNAVQSLYELPYAKTVEELKVAVSHAGAPGLNISWVNEQGDIAWWVLGKFPKLPEGIPYDVVLNGWDGKNEVERYYSVDENPHQVNPSSGIIITANYKPQLKDFEHFDGYWQPAGRYFRLEKLLKQKVKWSLDELQKIQTDDTVPIHEQVRAQVLHGINKKELTDFELTALRFFEDWDGKSDTTSVGSSIYHVLNYYLLYNLFSDEMGEEGFKTFGRTADFWHSFKKLFWDNVDTDHVESGSQIITQSFKESVLFLKEKFGQRVKFWTWGKLHTAEYIHPIGKQKPFNLIYNIGPIEANGGRFVINNLGHRKYTNDFRVVHGPATRRLIDMGNPKRSFGIIPTGNSGNPFSEHFQDQLKIYHSGKYRLQDMDWDSIKKNPLLHFRAGE
jgi:penicillin amidase